MNKKRERKKLSQKLSTNNHTNIITLLKKKIS